MGRLFSLEIRSPTDPTKKLPINVVVNVKREAITCEDVKKMSEEIRQKGIHLSVILTDKNPNPEALEDINYIPQIVLVVVELRDLVKLLVVSLAKRRGVDIDSSLLLQAYKDLIDKFALKDRIEKWAVKMANAGYLLTCEGFVDRTAQSCRFFINTTGRPLNLKEIWEDNWKLRGLLPFGGIKSEIIPDMGFEELKKHAEVLKNYGFLNEEYGKYYIQHHPVEKLIIELLEHYGGTTTKYNLAKHFVFKEAMSRVFDSILGHMERKMLIEVRHGNVSLVRLHNLKDLRERAIKAFEEHKDRLNKVGYHFANILTWKEREWNIVQLITMEKVIEDLLKEIATTDDEDIIRSRTFLIKELIEWYGHYVNKIILAYRRSEEIISHLSLEVSEVRRRFNEIFENVVKATKAIHLQIRLQELEEITSELEEVRKMLTTEEQLDVFEGRIERIAGKKKSKDSIRTDKLWTDIDEEMKTGEDMKGNWTVAKYLLIKNKIEGILERIDNLNKTLDALDKSSQEIVDIVNEFLRVFNGITAIERQKLSSLLRGVSKQIAETMISRPTFPSNVSILTITELSRAIEEHVKFLRNGIDRAKLANSEINSLSEAEEDFIKSLGILEALEDFYEKFWEERIPKNLSDESMEMSNKYKQMLEALQSEETIFSSFSDFNKIVHQCKIMRGELSKLNAMAESLLNEYKKLFEEIKQYFSAGSMLVKRFEENVTPKLSTSDKNKVQALLTSLNDLYTDSLAQVEMALRSASQGSPHISPQLKTRTVILEEERKLKENLIREIKDLNQCETLILVKVIELLAYKRSKWLPFTETCAKIARETNIAPNRVEQMILTLSEKGLISLAIGF
jgi:hypothetical protein